VLKLATVLFGERLDPTLVGQAVAVVSATPLLVAMGSTLLVEPVASLCRVAVDRGANLVIVNRDETPYDHLATEVIRTDIADAVPEIVDVLGPGSDPVA
jgi:NAD-dependent deacetylase